MAVLNPKYPRLSSKDTIRGIFDQIELFAQYNCRYPTVQIRVTECMKGKLIQTELSEAI